MSLFDRYRRERDDWYVEQEIAVEALLDAEDLSGGVYDPAAGGGTIPRVCERRGLRAVGSDKVDRGARDVRIVTPLDFLLQSPPLVLRMPHVVCNPPYGRGLPEAFLATALPLTRGKVCLLLPFTWYSSEGRRDLFNATPLARVRVFAYRVHMPPGRLLKAGLIEPENGKQTYAWFIWSHGHPIGKPPSLHRIERTG